LFPIWPQGNKRPFAGEPLQVRFNATAALNALVEQSGPICQATLHGADPMESFAYVEQRRLDVREITIPLDEAVLQTFDALGTRRETLSFTLERHEHLQGVDRNGLLLITEEIEHGDAGG